MSAALVLALLMLVMAFFSWKNLGVTRRRRRVISETPTSHACDVKEGHVEVKGRIVPIETIRSPLGKKDVVYSKWELQEERKLNRINAWATVASGEKRLPFFLEDDTGRVRIVPDQAELLYATDTVTAAMSPTDAPDEVKALLEDADVDLGELSGHQFRIVETYLESGDEIYVCGKARLGKDGVPVIDAPESRQVSFFVSDHKEEVIVDALRRAERAGTWGIVTLCLGALAFLVIGLG